MKNVTKINKANALKSLIGLAFLGAIVPSIAAAEPRGNGRYDGYCYQKKQSAKEKGAITGAIIGGLFGSNIAGKGNRTEGTVAGAVVGAVVGANAGKNSVSCYNDNYYSYSRGYFEAPPPPRGYVTVYYSQRPRFQHRHYVNYGRERYNHYDNNYRRDYHHRDWYHDDEYYYDR